ncbi:MAG: isoprenoid biosynthesis glyoxalase ElbB [Bacteroidales bacterium]|nr:isoprenoid biosynthesis glyoxalase ElbB [Bacteroidales bacterium]
MKKFAMILSGSGVFDGAEIHESTLTMLAIKRQGADYEIFAPDITQHHVVNHITGEEMDEKRNVLIEAARIARGDIKEIGQLDANDFDALIMPGGFGAAKNLSTFAIDGENLKVNPGVEKAVKAFIDQKKPVGALCISPVIIGKLLGDVELTIGSDQSTAEALQKMGATHKQTTHGQVIRDSKYNVFTTPCYMLDANILQIEEGANNVVKAMLETMK